MKISSKIKGLLLVALTAFFSAGANAQDTGSTSADNYDQGWRLGFGLNAGVMTDSAYDFALGGDVRLQYDFNKRVSVTLTSGFTNLFVGDAGKDLGFIPVKGGFKVFWWEDQFYVLAEAGAAIPVTNGYADTVDTSLLLSPGIGWASKYIDLSLRYEHYSAFPTSDGDKGVGQVGLRIAYGFRL
ncbi:MAG: hypothetical protein EOO48_06130 [Flavobacterium sp.]|nr:MAG: hypothetical protein EOO48_06130 [Flavobacterium sp.]